MSFCFLAKFVIVFIVDFNIRKMLSAFFNLFDADFAQKPWGQVCPHLIGWNLFELLRCNLGKLFSGKEFLLLLSKSSNIFWIHVFEELEVYSLDFIFSFVV